MPQDDSDKWTARTLYIIYLPWNKPNDCVYVTACFASYKLEGPCADGTVSQRAYELVQGVLE